MDSNQFTHHIISFGRVLRRAGLSVGTSQMMDALLALKHIGIRNRRDVYQAFYSIFVTRHDQVELFDQAFYLFFRAPSMLPRMMGLMLPRLDLPENMQSKTSPRVQQALAEELGTKPQTRPERRNEEKEAIDLVLTYSAVEVLRKKDFAAFSAEELLVVKQMLAGMDWSIARQRRRRFTTEKGRYLDLRRTIREGLRHHGEWTVLKTRAPDSKARDVAILCDISGSMERYSRMLLHFMHAFSTSEHKVETFVFGTRLTRITRTLRHRDIDDAVASVSKVVNDWAGGTRIGEAIKVFNFVWARRVLRSGAVVLIISDGWDRGDIPLLEREMARLARSCTRLIWLNPLLGYQDYEPLTRGIKTSLPYIDDFLPVHNLESLEQIGRLLAAL
ncbi:MAG: VWA domain-containing protein [bacterium]